MPPFSLKLPEQLAGRWRVKIFSGESFREEPHASIVTGGPPRIWRFSLRRRVFMDPRPDPKDLPRALVEFIDKKHEDLCAAWDAAYPHNPVASTSKPSSGKTKG